MNFEALRASTIPGLLVERALTPPGRVAFRSKELGTWRETTWRKLADRVVALARSSRANTGSAGARRWPSSATRARSGRSPIWRRRPLGAITYGIYPTSAPGEVRHLLQHGGAALIVVEDQEHLDNTLEVLDPCTKVRGVLVVDTRALFMDRHPRVRPLADLERPGRAALAAEPDALGRLARSLSPDDPATIITHACPPRSELATREASSERCGNSSSGRRSTAGPAGSRGPGRSASRACSALRRQNLHGRPASATPRFRLSRA